MQLFRKRQKQQHETIAAFDGGEEDVPMTERPATVPLSTPSKEGPSSATAVETVTMLPAADTGEVATPETEELLRLGASEAVTHARRGFVMAFENVCMETRSSFFRPPRALLRNVSGYLLPDTITIVMCTDPLCSRKMLEILAGVEERASGSVMANALPVVSTAFRRRVALITSTEVCSRDATVRSNLLFSVRMRVDTEHEEHIVREAAQAVHLQQLLDVKTEQLSPPQLYQLALGMELVQRPMLLALDSPTSNLSTGETHGFVSVLQGLVSGSGRLVVLSATEVPRALYEAADNFLLLGSQGDLLYSGPKTDLEEFFREQVGIQDTSGESIGELLAMLDEKNESARVAGVFASGVSYRRIRLQVEEHRKSIASNSFDPVPRAAALTPNYFRRWYMLTTYTCRRLTIGHRSFVIAWTILFLLFFLMASLIAWSGSDQNTMQNKRGVVFFLLSSAMQANIVLIDAEVREFFSAVHLRNNNYFDAMQYFTATVLRLVLPRVVFAVVAVACTLFLLTSPLALVVIMGLMSLAHASLMLLLVYWHPIEQDLWFVHSLYYGYCIILSGFLICLPTVPRVFPALSVLRYGYGGVVASELRDNPYSCDANASTSYCYTGNQYLAMEGFTHDSWGRSSLILLIVSVVGLALVAISMKLVWVPHKR
ncbi:putative ABC transporter [Trypanosoma grayi]|uniref:putative ABC transporter n=1 Tax=Trypanosoma grayi TaxID=71804 RepID=UPI0004F3F7B5|nr:putative ABC transporter [Trypanosoma grayi]KEG11461.1 putative ABC transporter [Trypanosoma grayi]